MYVYFNLKKSFPSPEWGVWQKKKLMSGFNMVKGNMVIHILIGMLAIPQCVYISKHHVVHGIYILFYLSIYTIKIIKKKSEYLSKKILSMDIL